MYFYFSEIFLEIFRNNFRDFSKYFSKLSEKTSWHYTWVVKKVKIPIFFFFSTQRNKVPILRILSAGFCGNTVKISSTSNEAYTSYSTIATELPLASSSNLAHRSVIWFLTAVNVSAVKIHRRLVNNFVRSLRNYHTHSQAICVSQQLTHFPR